MFSTYALTSNILRGSQKYSKLTIRSLGAIRNSVTSTSRNALFRPQPKVISRKTQSNPSYNNLYFPDKSNSASILHEWTKNRTSKIEKNCWVLVTGVQWSSFYCSCFRWCFCLYRITILDLYDFGKIFSSYNQMMIKMNVSNTNILLV